MSKERKEYKILSPKLDVVFQRLFGEEGSENITKSFLEAILNEKIENIDLSKNPILRREYKKDKLGILDVIAQINKGENVNIEMQVAKNGDELERILYYWSRMYIKGIQKGNNYKELNKTISIIITDFEIDGVEELGFHSKWQLKDDTGLKILTKKLEIHIIELSKMKKEEIIETENVSNLIDWLEFIENPESERVLNRMKENKALKEAKEKLVKMSRSERMQRIAEWKEKAIRDEKAIYNYGVRQGIEQGANDKTLQIAKKLIEDNVDIEIIMSATGLTKEEIEKLK